MWSAQAVRELYIDHTNAIYPACTEPELDNSAVGGIGTHTHNLHIFLSLAHNHAIC